MARRHNGEGSIFPYRNGFAAYAWITTPEGRRQRKYVYGQTREVVHEKWTVLTRASRRGPVAPRVPRLEDFLARWLVETVGPNLAPSTASNYELFTRLYIVPDLGRRKIDALTIRDVQSWMNELRTRCQCCAQDKDARRGAVPLVGVACRLRRSGRGIRRGRSCKAHSVRRSARSW